MQIYEKIKDIRKSNKMSQETFANILGVSRQSVISWEKGKTIPQTDMLINICEKFGYKLEYFIGENKKEVEKYNVTNSIFFEEKAFKKEKKFDYKEYKLWRICLINIIKIFLIISGLVTIYFIKNWIAIIIILVFLIIISKVLKSTNRKIYFEYLKSKFINNKEKGNLVSPFYPIYLEINDDITIKYRDNILLKCDKNAIDHYFLEVNNSGVKYNLLNDMATQDNYVYGVILYLKPSGYPFIMGIDVLSISKDVEIMNWFRVMSCRCLNDCVKKLNYVLKK